MVAEIDMIYSMEHLVFNTRKTNKNNVCSWLTAQGLVARSYLNVILVEGWLFEKDAWSRLCQVKKKRDSKSKLRADNNRVGLNMEYGIWLKSAHIEWIQC